MFHFGLCVIALNSIIATSDPNPAASSAEGTAITRPVQPAAERREPLAPSARPSPGAAAPTEAPPARDIVVVGFGWG